MIPIYRYMDSQPFQKNQMPFNPYQYPIMESVPSYMMMDPAKSCMPPHDSGRNCWHYGYPMPSYPCCNGGDFFPGYYNSRPQHLPVPPHQQMHCYGRYPPFPEPYYVQYVPPTHYNVEQPRYEFDKNMMRNHHCCGCPNSLCGQNQKEDRCVKIEEEKPDNQRKGSVVPFQVGNSQSPIVWIPPDYMGSEKEKEPSETGTGKQEKERRGLNSTENLEAVEKAPKFWSGWPLSHLSRLRSWLPDAEGMGAQSVQTKQQEDGKKEFPFPVIWMPAFGRPESAKKDVQNMDAPTKYTEEPSNVGKLVPTNILQKDDATCEGPEVVKTVNQSNIPEVDVNHKTEETNKKRERRCITVETAKDNEVRESSRNNVKGQSSTSPKKSRLPPVCLRVDPLPKKKNGNGSSRSQSYPKLTAVKESSQLDSKINNAIVEPKSEKIIKAVEVKTHESLDSNRGDKENISREPLSLLMQPQEKLFVKLCKEETEESTSEECREKDRTIGQTSTEKDVDEKLEVSSGDLVREEGKNEKPNLSNVEAAVLIQSAYRGYEVRKWELLKKMKQLAEVFQQVIQVQNRVKALELAPQDEKERVFVGEMIMRLLLKLDTIQGLHPSVREFRKSLANELVALQEKLDCMVMKPTEVVPEASMEKHAKHFDAETHDDIKEEEQLKDDVVAIGEIIPEEANESNSPLGESDDAHPLSRIDNMAGIESVISSTEKEHQKPTGDGNSELPEGNDKNTTKVYGAEQLVEVTEPEVQSEYTSELSSHDFSKHLEDVVLPSLMEDKRPEETISEAEMKQNVELVTNAEQKVGEVLQTDKQEETVNYRAYSLEDVQPAEDSFEVDASSSVPDAHQAGAQAGPTPQVLDKITISAPDENGQTKDQLAADVELPMREDNNPNNIEADKLEHIEMRREVSEAEENTHDLVVEENSDRNPNEKQSEGQEKCHASNAGSEQNGECLSYTKCENENEVSKQSAELPREQSNSNDDLNIQNELVSERNEQQMVDDVEKVLEDVQHQPMPYNELDNQARRACDESAELLEELSESYHNENIQNETVSKKNEEQIAGNKSKMAEDMLQEPCVLDPMPSNKLDNQRNKLHAAEEATPDGTSERGEESLPALPNASREMMDKHDLESEKEMDKKLVEENEKMREMVEKLMEAGKEQIAIISELSERVKDLEKSLARKKKLRRGCGISMSKHPMLNGRIKALRDLRPASLAT